MFGTLSEIKQKVWNEAENRERDLGTRSKGNPTGSLRACEPRARSALKTLTARVTDFFTHFEKKTDCFAVYIHLIFSSLGARIEMTL